MAFFRTGKARTRGFDSREPLRPTQIAARYKNGIIRGLDNNVYLVRKAHLAPYADARSLSDQLNAVDPLMRAFEALGGLADALSKRRFVSKGSYRHYQLLGINVPTFFEPDPATALYSKHKRDYARQIVDVRTVFLAVKLKSTATSTGVRDAVDSFVETMLYSGVPLSDYDEDIREISGILERANMQVPTPAELDMAESWWSDTSKSDSHYIPHSDHMHVFASEQSAKAAMNSSEECDQWPLVSGHNVLSIATVSEFDLRFVPSPRSYTQWASDMFAEGAIAISIRGMVEPAKITTEEMRRQHNRVRQDIEEMYKNNKMSRAEQEEQLDLLREISHAYEGGGFPTSHETSVLAAFNGFKDEKRLLQYSAATVRMMENRQYQGLKEMQLGSAVRQNPYVHELPSSTIACSGITSLNRVGDSTGAIVGFDERDGQSAYMDHSASYVGDSYPIGLIAGATGSGKLLKLSTEVPTPDGTTTIGELREGDTIFGRDGKPCKVTHLSPIQTPERAYKLTLSDGQSFIACSNHQWVASDRNDRVALRRPKHRAALDRARQLETLAARYRELALTFSPTHESTLAQIAELSSTLEGATVTTSLGVQAALDMVETPFEVKRRARERHFEKDVVKHDPVQVFEAPEALETLVELWGSYKPGRFYERGKARAAAARTLLASGTGEGQKWSSREICENIHALDGSLGMSAERSSAHVPRQLTQAGLTHTIEKRPVTIPMKGTHVGLNYTQRVYRTREALTGLALRALQQRVIDDSPYRERVVTTEEMLAEGVHLESGHVNFSIRLASPTDGPERDVPVEPYVLGAWLGDGATGAGTITCIDREILDEIAKAGYRIRTRTDKEHTIYGLASDLKKAGFKVAPGAAGPKDKHIPVEYLRASYAQRLAVLQGLMDTDGTISEQGTCELTLCHKPLADTALSLIRSLGIKVSMKQGAAGYTRTDKDTGEKTRVSTGTRYRMVFTTILPVFRLPRKKALLPAKLRETSNWLYVTSIEPVESEPMRCITVDSPDSTYLIGDFVPTHNTMVGLNLLDQWSAMGVPCIFIDPKNHTAEEGHAPVIRNMGGQVYSLDSLVDADGVFDPVRFSQNAQAAVEMGLDLIMSINPFGSRAEDFEVALSRALQYGIVTMGAGCLGEALRLAHDDGMLKGYEKIFEKCEELKESNAQFGAMYGRDPKGNALNVNDGVTLIEVGSAYLPIPEPGAVATTLSQRIAMALVRMMVFGSSNALTGRGGVVALDEAWVFLSAGRSQMERLGRLARSQRVFPLLMTQRVTDAVEAGLAGYISRGIILHISDEDEARAACELFKVEPTRSRLDRIRAKEYVGGDDEGGSSGFNFQSLKALIATEDDPDFPGRKRRRVVRGSVGYYADLKQRFIPVENVLPEEFLLLASTNVVDIQRRERVLARRRFEMEQAKSSPQRLMDVGELFDDSAAEESIFAKHEVKQEP